VLRAFPQPSSSSPCNRHPPSVLATCRPASILQNGDRDLKRVAYTAALSLSRAVWRLAGLGFRPFPNPAHAWGAGDLRIRPQSPHDFAQSDEAQLCDLSLSCVRCESNYKISVKPVTSNSSTLVHDVGRVSARRSSRSGSKVALEANSKETHFKRPRDVAHIRMKKQGSWRTVRHAFRS